MAVTDGCSHWPSNPPTHTEADAGDSEWVCGCMHLVDLQRSSQNLITHTHAHTHTVGHQVCFIFIVTETVDDSFHFKQRETKRRGRKKLT